jgi:hypothetical protein
LVGCARATNQTLKVENQIRKSLGLLILMAFRMLHSFELLNGVPDLERRLAMHITGDKTLLIEHENDGLGLLVSSETASESSAKTSVGFDRSS